MMSNTEDDDLEFEKGQEEPQQNIDDFVRMYLICQEPKVRPSDLQILHRKTHRSEQKPEINLYAPYFESIAFRMCSQFDLSIDDLAGNRIILLFYPKGQLSQNASIVHKYAKYRKVFKKMNTQIIFCTPDSYHMLRILGNNLVQEHGKEYLEQIILLTD